MCRSALTFFGLSDEYSENVYEQFFILKHYGGWSLYELYNLPSALREWWLKRTIKEYEEEAKKHKQAQRK